MYMVVSKWGIVAGHEAQVAEQGRAVRDVLRRQPGVQRNHIVLSQSTCGTPYS